MYTEIDFKYKKLLKEAVAKGVAVYIYAPGLGTPKRDGREYIEGPHYPKAHTWYAEVMMKDGRVIDVV